MLVVVHPYLLQGQLSCFHEALYLFLGIFTCTLCPGVGDIDTLIFLKMDGHPQTSCKQNEPHCEKTGLRGF